MAETAFGKYRLIAELGHGGMADVFLAVQGGFSGSGFRKLTVVKRLRQNLADEPEFVAMLVDEARIAARLNHPNVVQTNEVGEWQGQYFIAMEYLDGQPLHRIQHRNTQKIKDGSPPPFGPELQYIVVMDVLAGLHHAHELTDYDGTPLEIVHRDITPHNVFVTYEGSVKVVDFGIAKAAGRSSETRQGIIKGKVRYMAPEQAVGQNVDRRVDIFAVGIILWEIATGKRLWRDSDDLQIVQSLVTGQVPRSPRSVNPDVPEALDKICAKALAHDREERYATAEEFRNDLEQFLIDSGILARARRQIPAALDGIFKDKRAEIRSVIEKQLAYLDANGTSGFEPLPPPPMSTASASQPSVVSLSQPSSSTSASRSIEAPQSSSEGTRSSQLERPRHSALVVAAFGAAVVVAVLLVVGAVAVGLRGKTRASVDTDVPAEINIRINASPATAMVQLDDSAAEPVPVGKTVKRDGRQHRVRVEAAGYQPKSDLVTFSQDAVLSFDLVKEDTDKPAQPTTTAVAATAGQPAPTVPTSKTTVGSTTLPKSGTTSTQHAAATPPPPPGPNNVATPPPTAVAVAAATPPPPVAPPPVAPAAPAPPPVDVAVEYRKAVNHTVRGHTADVQACYDRAKVSSPQLAGSVSIGASLNPAGSVAGARVANSSIRTNAGNGQMLLETCLVDRFRSWAFPPPPPGASSEISYTFRFE